MIYPTLGILSLITGAMTKILGDTSGSRLAPRTMLGTRACMMSEERRVIESDKLLRANFSGGREKCGLETRLIESRSVHSSVHSLGARL